MTEIPQSTLNAGLASNRKLVQNTHATLDMSDSWGLRLLIVINEYAICSKFLCLFRA